VNARKIYGTTWVVRAFLPVSQGLHRPSRGREPLGWQERETLGWQEQETLSMLHHAQGEWNKQDQDFGCGR